MKSLSCRMLIALLLCSGLGARHADAQAERWRPIVLFGEVHDNAAQHLLRLEGFKAMLLEGARPALLMEQFDRERQPAIDQLRARSARPDADQVILAGSGAPATETRHWNWAFYRPLIVLALAYDLPIGAANVSRDDARRVIKDGLAAHGFNAVVPAEIERAQAEAIEGSHCGMLDAAAAKRLAVAQIARDQFMARLVEAYADRGAVLLAGNGHVRVDVGVPRWLGNATRRRTESIGLLEEGEVSAEETSAAYDRVFTTPRQLRDDPCKAMRGRAS